MHSSKSSLVALGTIAFLLGAPVPALAYLHFGPAFLFAGDGHQGSKEGPALEARFQSIDKIASSDNQLFVLDKVGRRVRSIDLSVSPTVKTALRLRDDQEAVDMAVLEKERLLVAYADGDVWVYGPSDPVGAKVGSLGPGALGVSIVGGPAGRAVLYHPGKGEFHALDSGKLRRLGALDVPVAGDLRWSYEAFVIHERKSGKLVELRSGATRQGLPFFDSPGGLTLSSAPLGLTLVPETVSDGGVAKAQLAALVQMDGKLGTWAAYHPYFGPNNQVDRHDLLGLDGKPVSGGTAPRSLVPEVGALHFIPSLGMLFVGEAGHPRIVALMAQADRRLVDRDLNSFGSQGAQPAERKLKGLKRLAIIGDSTTFVNDAPSNNRYHSFPVRLERELSFASALDGGTAPVEIVYVGVNLSEAMEGYAGRAVSIADRLKAVGVDELLYCTSGSTYVHETFAFLRVATDGDRLLPQLEPQKAIDPVDEDTLGPHSRKIMAIARRFDKTSKGKVVEFVNGMLHKRAKTCELFEDPEFLDTLIPYLDVQWQPMVKALAARGIKVRFAFLPDRFELAPSELHGDGLANYCPGPMGEGARLRSMAHWSAQGWPAIDVTSSVTKVQPSYFPIFKAYDHHFSATGHGLIAKILAQQLRRQWRDEQVPVKN